MKVYIVVKEAKASEPTNEGAFYNRKAADKWVEDNHDATSTYSVEVHELQK